MQQEDTASQVQQENTASQVQQEDAVSQGQLDAQEPGDMSLLVATWLPSVARGPQNVQQIDQDFLSKASKYFQFS